MEEPTAKAYVFNNNQLLAFDPGFSVGFRSNRFSDRL